MAAYPGRTTEESVRIKLDSYLLNLHHPVGGSKARWYKAALGFTRSNMDELAKQLVFNPAEAVLTVLTKYGQKFVHRITITGANGRRIDVECIRIHNPDGVIRLVTAPPPRK